MKARATHVAVIDAGTTAIKAAVIDLRGRIRGSAVRRCPWVVGADGTVECDPEAFARRSLLALREAVKCSGVAPSTVAAVSVTNQRATVLGCANDGRAVTRMVSWQDSRGMRPIHLLSRKIDKPTFCRITGLPMDPVFTIGKVLSIKNLDKSAFRRSACFVLVDGFLLRRLGAESFFCDWSNASLTGMLDVSRVCWSKKILAAARIPGGKLPELVASGSRIGALSRDAAKASGLQAGTPLVAGGGDQQCAGIGAGAVEPGVVALTIGTAAVPLCAAVRPVRDRRMRIMSCVHAVPGMWEVEGLQSCAGACLEWYSRLVNGGSQISDGLFRGAARVPAGASGVLFYPHLTGASSPHWNPAAGGMFLGMRLGHGRVELLRAVMEGVAMQTREVLDVFAALGLAVGQLRLTGGCTEIGLWNRIFTDVLAVPTSTLRNPHATLVGAAVLAGVGAGAFASVQEGARRMVHVRRTLDPDPARADDYEHLYRVYKESYHRIARAGVFDIAGQNG